MITLPTVSSGS